MSRDAGTKSGARRCPICGRPAVDACRPFCSKRCARIDLGRWLKGVYVLPGETPADLDRAPPDRDAGEG